MYPRSTAAPVSSAQRTSGGVASVVIVVGSGEVVVVVDAAVVVVASGAVVVSTFGDVVVVESASVPAQAAATRPMATATETNVFEVLMRPFTDRYGPL
jgi:hypothetical protein